MNLTTLPHGKTIEYLAHDSIVPSTLNPRTHFDPRKLEDLQASFRAHGFMAAMSHLLVRCHPTEAGKFELICGERRWRAAGAEKIAVVPAVVEGMSDLQVLEFQLVENLQRDDLTAIEEAEGYRRTLELRDGEGKPLHTFKSLAEKIGRTEMHVRDRLALCRLRGTPAGDALEAGELTITHARLLARLPGAKLRDALTRRVLKEQLAYRALETIIRHDVMVELRGAEFDPKDAELVPVRTNEAGEREAGGACTDCPFNTKNIEGAETGKMHMCMHPDCFREKATAAHAAWQASVTKPGVEALGIEAAEEIFDYTGKRLAWNAGYVEIKDSPAEHELKESAEKMPWKKLIKGQEVPIVLVKDQEGTVHELVERALAKTAAEQNGHKIFRKAEPAKKVSTEERVRENERYRREQERVKRIELALQREMLGAAKGLKKWTGEFWELMAEPIIETLADHGDIEGAATMLGVVEVEEMAYEECQGATTKAVAELSDAQRPGAVLMLAGYLHYSGECAGWLKRAAKLLGVDAKAVEKRVKGEIEAEEKQAAEAKEIAEGMRWVTRREKAGEFEWEGKDALNPDVCEVAMPAGVKQTVAIFAARGKTGWHAGFKVVNGKAVEEVAVVNSPPDYGTRELAVKAVLLAIHDYFSKAAVPAAVARINAYVELVAAPTPTGKGAKKKGAKK